MSALQPIASAVAQCLCGGRRFETVFEYREPPAGEVRFRFSAGGEYRRRVVRCADCGHFLSLHDMDMGELYSGAYVEATYGADGLRRTFERIVALPPEKSDNAGRVARVVQFARSYFPGAAHELAVMDIGSGLCVFLHRLKRETGWRCTALDPDPRAAAHALEVAGVEAICGDFMTLAPSRRYDLLTFNKVLEHVTDPVAMLRRAAAHLASDGAVYIELPDGEAAMHDGPGREEFFIDHHHVFSRKSLGVLAQRAGFSIIEDERLREPSSKYTLHAFLVSGQDGSGV
jgi:SAM-dependent methyltransferase